MSLHSSATATAAGQSLREEQERRAEAERQVQPLKKTVSGELPTLFPIHCVHLNPSLFSAQLILCICTCTWYYVAVTLLFVLCHCGSVLCVVMTCFTTAQTLQVLVLWGRV